MEFEYMGYHFLPLKKLPEKWDFLNAMQHTKKGDLNLNNYDGGAGWNYDEFYKNSTDKEADIFLCMENGKEYIPAQNELFLFIICKEEKNDAKQSCI